MTNEKYGVLLVNLGTPTQPTYLAVRRFLRDFLSDPRVVDAPRIIWLPLLYGIILSLRPFKVSKNYKKIWTDKGSPLFVYTMNQKTELQAHFLKQGVSEKVKVEVEAAMTYGEPSIEASIHRLVRGGVKRLIVLPLYPQYSYTTTAPVTDQLDRLMKKGYVSNVKDSNRQDSNRQDPDDRKSTALSLKDVELSVINDYHKNRLYVQAVALSIKPKLKKNVKLVMSFHGLPKRYVLEGDPYQSQCEKTAKLIAIELGLQKADWEVAYQSRVGREEWLSPYLDQRMTELPNEGCKSILVVCPGFSSDCLETLEEIAMENRNLFMQSGGEKFEYVSALNTSANHIEMMVGLVLSEIEQLKKVSIQHS